MSTYKQAPTDLGCGWSLDFPWIEVEQQQPGKYMHGKNGTQTETKFVNGVWEDREKGFVVYKNADGTYTKYRKDGVREEYDNGGRITSMVGMNGNVVTFTYGQIGYTETGPKYGLIRITDTVGRTVNFSYSGAKLMSLSDGVRTITYSYAGDKLVSVTDPLGRVTTYDYMAGNSFLITGVHYPSGGFSIYEYTSIAPERAKLAPYKSSQTENGVPIYYVYKVDSPDTVAWTSPKDLYTVTSQGGRPCVLQRDDGSLVMYFKDTYVWTEEQCEWVGCPSDCEYVCNTITHTEYWLKRSVSQDQKNWSAPQNVIQVKNTTGNPVVIEKRDGSYIMYYLDTYVWSEQNCYWDRIKKEYVCETITHTEYWIYRRTSSDGITWGAPVKFVQTSLGVRNISAIQKQDGTFLLCYTDKVGTSYYIRQITSTDGLTWSTPSNVIQVDSTTGNPALIQKDTGEIYLAYRKGNNYVYVQSNTGQGWSSPVQTTAQALGDPALMKTASEIVLIYKGTDEHCYRISSANGQTWSSPSQIAPNKIVSDPSTVDRKDLFYRVSAQYLSASELDLVRIVEFSYEGEYNLPFSSNVIVRDSQTVHSSMHFTYDSQGRTAERVARDKNGVQTEKIVYTYDTGDRILQQSVYAGNSQEISYSTTFGYDNWGNVTYSKDPEGAEHFYSYANTSSGNQFTDSKGAPMNLFSNAFYSNTIPSHCHSLVVGDASSNRGKVKETYYRYDIKGNLTETKILFPTRDYAIFSGTFDEGSQTTFTFDLSGVTLSSGILVITSIPVSTLETLHEIHSRGGKGWHKTGDWQEESFYADYTHCAGDDCYDGETEIGPFEHYPGTPNFVGTTTWVEDNVQYVQANYSALVNECPEKVEYNLNSGIWTQITANLGTNTTSITIPLEQFIQGVNTVQFRDSNTYSTKFEWTLYMNQGATPQEYITRYSYDSYGNLTSIIDAEGHTKTYSYSANYQYAYLTSITDALGNTTSLSYDFSTGLAMTITTPNGNTSTYQYDLPGRVTRKVNPDLSQKEVVYDDLNNCVTIYDELDHFAKKYYDGLDRLNKVEWYRNGQVYAAETYTYDYLNNLLAKTDPGGHVYGYEYDSRGRTVRTINPCGNSSIMEFDDANARVKRTDENGHCKEYQYDWAKRLIAVKEYTDPVTFYLTHYEYDQAGNLTKITNANDEETLFTYDTPFGPTLITYPDGTMCHLTYDSVGTLLTETDGRGTTTYGYDAAYRRIQIQYADQSTVQFTYDPNGNQLSTVNDFSTTAYTYDNRNQLISMTQTIDGVNYTLSYDYDAAGRLLSLTYPDGTVITRTYDDLNRLTSVGMYAQCEYSVDSTFETVMYGNGVVTTYDYDPCHHPLSVAVEKSGEELLHLEYTYDFVGNVVQLTKTWSDPFTQSPQTVTESYGYDALDRLLSASAVNEFGTVSFTYDPVGNRVQQVLNGEQTQYTYLPYDKLATAGEWTFTYDTNGNTLSKTSETAEWSYQYDVVDRLTEVLHNTQVIATYVYNGNSQRIKKTEWNPDSQQYETTVYLYAQGNVYYEKNVTTGHDALYLYGPTGRIAKKVGDETMYYHTDHLGSTRLLTDQAGNPVTAVEYSPFGTPEQSGGKERYLFTGQEMDSTGLYYCKARYYDPETGRFLTRDSSSGDYRRPRSLNKYVYCLNNPLRYSDPSGNKAVPVDEDVEDIIAENNAGSSEPPPSEEKQSSCTTSACQLAYDISRALAYQLHTKFVDKSYLVSQSLMWELESILANEEDRKEFENGWKEGFIDGCDDVSSPKTAQENSEKFKAELEDDVQCLVDHIGNELVVSGLVGMVPTPTVKLPAETIQAVIYVARENYRLEISKEYDNFPPTDFEQYCCEEERSLCAGTSLLCIFIGLGILMIPMHHKRRRSP